MVKGDVISKVITEACALMLHNRFGLCNIAVSATLAGFPPQTAADTKDT